MDDDSQITSSRLYKLLDVIGASEDIRWRHWETAMLVEILRTAHYHLQTSNIKSCYMFGSSCEGTTTIILQSDVDMLYCSEDGFVMESIKAAPRQGLSLLMVTDADTKPGYVHLQCVMNGVALTVNQRDMFHGVVEDRYGRLCIHHDPIKRGNVSFEQNGPAHTRPGRPGFVDQDHVLAYECKTIPSTADTWLHRERLCKWPSRQQLKRMASYGCFFVGVGHPTSQQKSIEWRISFSLQERELMSCLNNTQHKCYIILKMIKKEFLQPIADKSISSYHCKTCLFYTIENSKNFDWNSQTLIKGIVMCLERLLRYVKEGNCPNFFIPEENMFDKCNHDILENVAFLLDTITSNIVRFLCLLQGKYFGAMVFENSHKLDVFVNLYRLAIDNAMELYNIRKLFFISIYKVKSAGVFLSKTISLLRYMEHTDSITKHTARDVRMTFDTIIPHIHLQVAQSIASIVLTNRGSRDTNMVPLAFYHHLLCSNTCDLFSARLILVTYRLQSEMFGSCEDILLTCEISLKPHVFSMCQCHGHYIKRNNKLGEKLVDHNMSFAEFRVVCLTSCISILPSQAILVHPALQYEMFRSVFTPAGSRMEDIDFWFDWIVIDSQVYLYFLRYILYTMSNKPSHKQESLNKLLGLIDTDPRLGHRETAYNVLGWIYNQENLILQAYKCFCRSLRIRQFHNAAKWHLAVILYDVFV